MNRGEFLNIIIALIVFGVIAAGGVYFVVKNRNSVNAPPPAPTVIPPTTNLVIPSDWKVFSNVEYGFQFNYPKFLNSINYSKNGYFYDENAIVYFSFPDSFYKKPTTIRDAIIRVVVDNKVTVGAWEVMINNIKVYVSDIGNGCGAGTCGTATQYAIQHGQYWYKFSLSYLISNPAFYGEDSDIYKNAPANNEAAVTSMDSVIEQIISSIKFTK